MLFRWFAAIAVTLLCTDLALGQNTVQTVPSNVIVEMGKDAMMDCTVEGANDNTVFAWSAATVGNPGLGKSLKIFENPPRPTGEPFSAHYSIMGTYNLGITQTSMDDGGLYICRLINDDYTAVLLVVDTPILELSESTVEESTIIRFNCSVRFSAPDYNDLGSPRLMMRFSVPGASSQDITSEQIMFSQSPNGALGIHTLNMAGQMRADRKFHDKSVKCEVYSTTPQFMASQEKQLDILHAPQNVEIHPQNVDLFYVDDVINCTATANPAPSYQWRKVTSPDVGTTSIPGQYLTITSKMVGSNEWTCVVSSRGISVEESVVFIVDSGTRENEQPNTGGSGDDEGGSNGSWVVPVAVIIPLIIIIVIVVVVIYFVWYKRSSKPSNNEYGVEEAGKPGMENRAGAFDDEKKSHNPALYANAPGVNNNPDKAGRNAPIVSTNPNPYPGQEQPIRSGRDSPGYADLGEQQIRSSNPALNLDVSFDRPPQEGNQSFSIQPDAGYDNRMYNGSPHGRQPAPRLHRDPLNSNTQV